MACTFPRIKVCNRRKVTINHDVLHSLHDVVLIKVTILGAQLIYVLFKGTIRYLVICLVHLIVVCMHLKAVVCEMNKLALTIQGIRGRTGSQVARLVDIKVPVIVNQCQHADIKLSTLVEQRTFDVFLHDEGVSQFSHENIF